MSSDHEAEIRASVAAHADLGPGYDDAVAEGLVERIGAEILLIWIAIAVVNVAYARRP
jgi:hypothetical protein